MCLFAFLLSFRWTWCLEPEREMCHGNWKQLTSLCVKDGNTFPLLKNPISCTLCTVLSPCVSLMVGHAGLLVHASGWLSCLLAAVLIIWMKSCFLLSAESLCGRRVRLLCSRVQLWCAINSQRSIAHSMRSAHVSSSLTFPEFSVQKKKKYETRKLDVRPS